MRAFVGIPVSEEIREKVKKLEEEIKIEGVKIVEPKNLHWTVKFLGEIGEREVERVKEVIENVEKKDIEIEVKGVGVFPNISRIRVIWLGVGEGREAFTDFIKSVNEKLSGIGKESEVVPHLTIGRVKFVKDRKKLMDSIEKIKNACLGKMAVRELVLYESKLTPKGPIYTEVKKVKW